MTVIATGFENGQPYRTDRSASRPSGLPFAAPETNESGARIPEFLRQRQMRADASDN